MFIACLTQWEYPPMGGVPLGLDYPAVESVMRMLSVADQNDCFRRVQIMERAALEELRKQHGQ